MDNSKLHGNLDAWLAQFPEPAAEPEPDILEVPEWLKKSARFFGFDPDALTWVNDEDWGVVALIDDIVIDFNVDNDDDGEVCFARTIVGEWRSNDVYSQNDLAKAIRFAQQVQRKQRENEAIKAAQAEEYAKRTRVMQFEIWPESKNDSNKHLAQLMNDGWVIAFCNVVIYDNTTLYCYTLTRD